MTKPETITKQLIGWDKTFDEEPINWEPIYLTIYWDEATWTIHTEQDEWQGFVSGGGTDSEASEYIRQNLLDSGWFEPVDDLDELDD